MIFDDELWDEKRMMKGQEKKGNKRTNGEKKREQRSLSLLSLFVRKKNCFVSFLSCIRKKKNPFMDIFFSPYYDKYLSLNMFSDNDND